MTKRRKYDSSDDYEEFERDSAGEENPNIILTVYQDKLFSFKIDWENESIKCLPFKQVSFF